MFRVSSLRCLRLVCDFGISWSYSLTFCVLTTTESRTKIRLVVNTYLRALVDFGAAHSMALVMMLLIHCLLLLPLFVFFLSLVLVIQKSR